MKRRIICIIAALAVLLGQASFAAAADTAGWFYFSAEVKGQTVVYPTKIYYRAGQTVLQALAESPIEFGTEAASGFITSIGGVSGNYSFGTKPEGLALDSPAEAVQLFRFTESENSTPSAALQSLIVTMADLSEEEPDVQLAAKTAYESACARFAGISDADAFACAAAIRAAADGYKESLQTRYAVAFPGFAGGEYEVFAVNDYGRVFADENHSGILLLPAGQMHFTVRQDALQVSGTVTVSQNTEISAEFPTGGWLDGAAFAISGSYGEDFEQGRFASSVSGHTVSVHAEDTFSGALYPYIAASAESAAAIYTDTAEKPRQRTLALESKVSSIPQVLACGSTGNSVTLRLSRTGTDGFVQSEDYTLTIDRIPTLSALTVKNAAGTAQVSTESFSPLKTEYTYKVLSKETSLTVLPTAASADSTVTVNGQAVTPQGVSVSVDGETDVCITVANAARQTQYLLHILPGDGKKVTFSTDSGVSLRVLNKNGEELTYTKRIEANGSVSYLYTLVADETYCYIASADEYYHVKKEFTPGGNTTFSVKLTPEELLTGLAAGSSVSTQDYLPSAEFSPSGHQYTIQTFDYQSALIISPTFAKGTSCEIFYDRISTDATDKTRRSVTAASGAKVRLSGALLLGSAYENTVTVRLSRKIDATGEEFYTDTVLCLKRTLSLSDLSLQTGGANSVLHRENSEDTGFSQQQADYFVQVPSAASEISVSALLPKGSIRYGDTDDGYCLAAALDGQTVSTGEPIALNGTNETQTLTLTVTNSHAPTAQSVYTVQIRKLAATGVRFSCEPNGANLFLCENESQNRVYPENGSYALSEGFIYRYLLTAPHCVGQSGYLRIETQNGTDKVLALGTWNAGEFAADTYFGDLADVRLSLSAAAENTALRHDLSAEWADFRGTAYHGAEMGGTKNSNNAVTDAKTPVYAEDGTLLWAVKLGDGYSSSAVSSPILVDGHLIVYAGDTIFRVNKDTGAVEKTGKMAGKSSFAINSPTYCDGMLFVGLSDGRVQAFDAVTLRSLWLYTDPYGGQPNCPITVCNERLYTGFWNSETGKANFVCLTLTDEDPSSETEAKCAAWTYTAPGGFYWAGAYACEDFVMVGTDDGRAGCTAQSSRMLLLDAKSGSVLDTLDALHGDLRCTVCYDENSDAFYFTSKGGSFYRVRVQKTQDGWEFYGLDSLSLGGMSTSTPVVYQQRAYIGVCGSGQFTAYSGHHLAVIDLAQFQIAYSVPTQGYPQTSGLLTTAYEKTGYIYVYFFDNYTPGKLRVLRDRAGQTSAEPLTAENGESMAYALFTPVGDQAQYSICSPITDEYGTVYFKNDSACLMAYASAVESLTVTHQPDKTAYEEGETFDKTGLVVTARLANGMEKDVTAQMTAPQTVLSGSQTAVTLEFSRDQTMYHNQPETDGTMTAGVKTVPLTVTVPITVSASEEAPLTLVSVQPDSVSVKVRVGQDAALLAAVYRADGMLLAACRKTVSAGITQTDVSLPCRVSAGQTVRVFLLDAAQRPLTESKSITVS